MAQTHAFRFHETGGPEVLTWEAQELPRPGAGEALVRHTAVGLNYIDTYFRSGLYPAPLPSGIGMEAAGVVEAIGDGVTEVVPGDRVAYAGGPLGAYSQSRVMPARHLVRLPDGIDDVTAAAMMLKGMTAEYLIRRTYPVKEGQTVLFHASAGGVGLIAGQWLKALGATVIGTAGGPEKVKLALARGYDHVIDYTSEDIAARVKELTNGEGVPVVFDSVGKSTFEASLDCLAPHGYFVSFGNSSGPVPPVPPTALRGSLYFTRPVLMAYTSTRPELEATANALFAVVADGKVRIEVNQTYKLTDAIRAHRDLEARRTTGSTVFTL